MFTNIFKKPMRDLEQDEIQKDAENALQVRMNRMVRQNLKVEFTPPPTHPKITPHMAMTRALRNER